MLRNDYIMRMIEQFTMVLEKILFKKEHHMYQEARIDIDQAFTELLGLDHEAVRVLSLEGLFTLLKLNGRLDTERCKIAAELLKEDAEVLELDQDEGAGYDSYQKALCLYIELFKQQDDRYGDEADQNIRFIINKLERYEMPDAVKKRVVEYYELSGEYARAEDMLFRLLESNAPDSFDYGKRFYERLLLRSDDDLERGHLPRDEIQDGLRNWRAGGATSRGNPHDGRPILYPLLFGKHVDERLVITFGI